MAYSYRTYPGTGAQTDFQVDFPYLDADHIGVTVDGVSTAFTWVNSQTVRISPAPGNGTSVKISRDSSRSSRIANFADSQSLTAASLNEDIKQAFYVAQEAFDAVAEAPSGGDMRAVNNLSEVNPSAARANLGALASSNPAITGNLTLDAAPSNPLHAVSKAWVEAQIAAIPSGSGEVNTMASVGAGASLYKEKAGVQFKLRTLVQGTGVVITEGADTIQIDATGVGGGEVNVGANVNATGEPLYTGKSGVALQFKGVGVALGVKKTVTANDVTLAIDEAASIAWTAAHSFSASAGTDTPVVKTWSLNNGAMPSANATLNTGYLAVHDVRKTTNAATEPNAGNNPGGIHAMYVQHDVAGVANANARLFGGIRSQVTGKATGSVATEYTAFYGNAENQGSAANYAWSFFCDLVHNNSNASSRTFGFATEVIRQNANGDVYGFGAQLASGSTQNSNAGFIVSKQPGATKKFTAGFAVADAVMGATVDYGFDCAYADVAAAGVRVGAGHPIRMSGTNANVRDIVWNSTSNRIEFQYNGTLCFDIPTDTGSGKTYAFGMRTTAASGFTKDNPTDGAASPKNPVTYIRVKVDGTNYRLALYND